MTIKEQINNDIKDAMRAKDKNLLNALRLISAAVKQIEVDERIEVDDERMLVILDKMSKQRKESIAQFEKASRDDLVAQEQFELNVISKYLPEPLTDNEIEELISDAIKSTGAEKMSDMGKVMAILKPKLQGRADMAQVSTRIKAKLS
ncbi:TPA: lpg2359 family Dot/Icm T4SS effector [Legionella pneumophila subsp. pneumophila]|uniref:GatB/YqeY domain-containing protein n=1 Tax=Legionella pneumophila (strain Lens) TaxID=297245 RepID=Q5WU87_LEGPL|nr:lpg2359 family Dot/Icm T4SS effector [Legionella pneumophila]AOW51196.1 glutamyl-tRNA amidotransferase [Legionella pneumophila subsp. pneumophila]AOW55201.1 glutamyl-tRNA amidotransferase [Legionella pneumophila subsp. pneumophila]AOW59216.1 glutamyl-tRNA amidotransferase [Legionella pneumophila subsp. pneumophila]AOW60595.1 glutamyl-tRNA amidotransferase [Legionella pneumophila subsp. pneumophila]AOW64704.1 glutamyl-tRNA amidotransferase [Legionella pneumophila subsp. pneumophila]